MTDMKHSHNNKGFSLVELIVVVAVIAILAGITVGSVGLVGRSKAKSAAQTVDSMLSRCKMENLSGQNCYVAVNGSTVKILLQNGTVLEEKQLDSSVSVTLNPTECTSVGFDMKTGAVLGGCESITVVNSQGKVLYKIELVTLTGEHRIN